METVKNLASFLSTIKHVLLLCLLCGITVLVVVFGIVNYYDIMKFCNDKGELIQCLVNPEYGYTLKVLSHLKDTN